MRYARPAVCAKGGAARWQAAASHDAHSRGDVAAGRYTFWGPLACIGPRGHAISCGTASGQVEPFPLQDLHKKSLTVTRPTLATYIASREDLEMASDAVFGVLRDGTVKVDITGRYALKDAADAHRAIESRKTTGAMILLP